MSGKTHAAVGAACALGTAVIMNGGSASGSKEVMIAGTLAAIWGAIFPDVDVQGSVGDELSRKFCRATIAITILLAVAIMANYFGVAVPGVSKVLFTARSRQRLSSGVLIGLASFNGLFIFGSHRPHREATHSLLFLVLTTASFYLMTGGLYYTWFFIGYASHLAIDVLNKKGESILWPSKQKFCLDMCTASGIVDKALGYVSAALAAFILFVL